MKPILLFLSAVMLHACSAGQDQEDRQPGDPTFGKAPVTAVQAPGSAKLGEEVPINVEFYVYNGCGSFHEFKEESSGTTRTIEVEAQYRDGICTQALVDLEAVYTFKPETEGEYILRFKKEEDEYEEIRILVE